MAKILFYTQYYAPETNAPSNRLSGFIKYLKKDNEIVVLTTFPNHPLGKIFPGYKNKWFQKEVLDDINIYRSYSYIPHNLKNKFERLRNYFSFALSSFINFRKILKYEKNVDIIIASSPPISVAIIGTYMSYIAKKPLIIDLRDIWPDAALSLNIVKKNFWIMIITKLEMWSYNRSSKILVNSPGLKDVLIRQKHIDNKKIIYLPNGFDFDLLKYVKPPKNLKEHKKFIVMYSGLLGLAQNPLIFIDMAINLQEYPNIQILIVGEGIYKKDLKYQIEQYHLNNILLLNYMSRTEVLNLINNADLMLITYKHNDMFRNNIPSKLFEFLALGKPILINLEGEGSKIIKESQSGECINTENGKELAMTILKYYNNQQLLKIWGQNGKQYVQKYFDQTKLSQQLNDLIQSIIA